MTLAVRPPPPPPPLPPLPLGAPAGFETPAGTAVPADLERVELELELDARARTCAAKARVRFRPLRDGFPFLDLVPDPARVALDGRAIDPAELAAVPVRDERGGEATTVRVLRRALLAGAEHELEVAYGLRESLCFEDGCVAFGTFLSDAEATPRRLFERYAPANLEFDQFELRLDLRLRHARLAHELFANGAASESRSAEEQRWEVRFPSYFTACAPYVHLTCARPERELHRETGRIATLGGEVPFLIYAHDAALPHEVRRVVEEALPRFAERFGAYPHPALLIYAAGSRSHPPHPRGVRGMEYCGAAVVGPGEESIRHELLHSWFGRGVFPASGNDNWLDEALVEWALQSEHGRRPSLLGPESAAEAPLSSRSPFRRGTPPSAYALGASFLFHVEERVLRAGGPPLAELVARYFGAWKLRPITTDHFRAFLESETGVELAPDFERFVYGRSDVR